MRTVPSKAVHRISLDRSRPTRRRTQKKTRRMAILDETHDSPTMHTDESTRPLSARRIEIVEGSTHPHSGEAKAQHGREHRRHQGNNQETSIRIQLVGAS